MDDEPSVDGEPSVDDFLRAVAATGESPAFAAVPRTAGRYRVGERLGAGGLGSVYRAHDPGLHRDVAIKFVRIDRTGGETGARLQERLRREARVLARLSHPNVVEVYDVGDEGGQVYIAMEHLTGPTLRGWLRQGRRSPESIVAAYLAAGEGLSAAHRAGVVHRDFKPDNVIVDGDRVVVVDFGLARQDESTTSPSLAALKPSDREHEPLTRSGFLGTSGYAAPEQERREQATPRSDQYSFCVSLWEALSGHRPQVPDPDVSAIPTRYRAALLRGLARDPAERWPDLHALLEQLRRPSRRWWKLVATGAATATVGTLAMFALAQWTDARERAECLREAERGWDLLSHRETIEQGIGASGLIGAREEAKRTAATLDAYGRRALDVAEQLCALDASSSTREAAKRCLADRRQHLDILVGVVTERPTADIVFAAAATMATIPAVEPCLEHDWLHRRYATGSAANGPDEVLLRAGVLADLGAFDQAREAAEAALAVPNLHDADRARALLVKGRALDGQLLAATEALERSYELATQANEDAIAADAAIELAGVVGIQLSRNDEGRRWARAAESRLDSGNGTPQSRARVEHVRGLIEEDLGRALDHFERARSLLESSGAAEPVLLRDLEQSIAFAYGVAGEYDDASAIYDEVLRRTTTQLGDDHPELVERLVTISHARILAGDLPRAEREARWALELAEVHFSPDHRFAAFARQAVADALIYQGRGDEALQLMERVVVDLERELGEDHYRFGVALDTLGGALVTVGRRSEAAAAYNRALIVLEATLGRENQNAITVRFNLADLSIKEGDHDRASVQAREVIELRERVLGATHPRTGDAYNLLSVAELNRGNSSAAFEAAEHALRIVDASVGPEHPSATYPLLSLSRIHMQRGELEAAIPYLERALETSGPSKTAPEASATVRMQLATALLGVHQPERARQLALEARAVYEEAGEAEGVRRVDEWLARKLP